MEWKENIRIKRIEWKEIERIESERMGMKVV